MQQKNHLIIGLFIIIGIVLISGCIEEIPKEMPSNFEIYYSFGVGEKNILDTKNNLYVKDMVCDPDRNYTIALTQMEKQTIYASIVENGFFNLPSDMTLRTAWVTPYSSLTLKITVNQNTHTVKWGAGFPEQDPNYKKLREITKTIGNIISQREEEMDIEQPRCGYL